MAYEKVGRSFVYHAAARTGSTSKRFFVAERRENKAQGMTFHNQKMDKVELNYVVFCVLKPSL
jgi:hypothetical protein